MTRAEELIQRLPRYSAAILAVALGVTVLAVAQIVDLRTGEVHLRSDPSADRLLPEDDEAVEFYKRVRDEFGKDETLVVAVHSDDLFSEEGLARISRMTTRIERLQGVHHVLSIANARDIVGRPDEIVIQPFFSDVPSDPGELGALRDRVLAHPIYGGNLVARDGRTAALVVYFLDMTHREYARSGLNAKIEQIAEEERGAAEIWITGGPHIRAVTSQVYFQEALSTLPTLILLALGGVLLFSFRTIRGVLLPLGTIVIGLVWTLALVVVIGYELNTVTILVPILLTTLGFSYSVHVVSEFYEVGSEEASNNKERVGVAMQRVSVPVVLTGVTTAAGFAALVLTDLPAVRQFGVLSVIGVACAVAASLSFTPAVLALLPSPRPKRASSGRSLLSFDRFAERMAGFDLQNRTAIFVCAGAIALLAVYGATEIRVGTQQISKFRESDPVRVHFESVNEHLEGANLLFVVLQTEDPDGFKEPIYLQEIQELQNWLQDQPEVGGTTSLVDYLKLLNRAFHDDDPAYDTIPPTRRAVAEMLFFGGGEELKPVVNRSFRTAVIRVRARVIDSDEVTALTGRIRDRLGALPSQLTANVTGTAVVLNESLDRIIVGQARSVVAALGIIYLILAAQFMSLRVGLVALIPNMLPVAVYFGVLGWAGIRLHSGTSLIAPMVLGIAVDDTIHYFERFKREARRLADEKRATVSALKSVGRPVTYTTAGLCLGFLVCNFSALGLAAEVGSLAAFALAFAWLTDFVLTPALCARMRIATLWDFLTVDLGHEPQHSLTLLNGLRATQARIVALMGHVVDVPAGKRLYNAGEPGDALYVVVAGKLRATVSAPDGTRDLEVHTRGHVLGEAGLFQGNRVATVDVEEETRLLRIRQDSLDHLGRRYPRVAAVVFQNLTQVLADRMAVALNHDASPARLLVDGEALAQKGRALEEAFFRKGADAHREQLLVDQSLDELSFRDRDERSLFVGLSRLGIRADTLAALTLTPLIEIAWADGRIDAGEREALLAAAEVYGISPDSPSFGLLRSWLDERPAPELLRAWRDYVQALCGELSVEGQIRLANTILNRARDVAAAAGGLMGLGAISRQEERVLSEFEQAFGERG